MKLCALFIIVVLAVGLPWPAGAVTREELVCPVRADWGEKEWENWEEEERQNENEWSGMCPCEKGWKPTEQQLNEILHAHKTWMEMQGWSDPAVSGQALLCNADLKNANLLGADLVEANLQEADLTLANLDSADLSGANLQKAKLEGVNLQTAGLVGAKLQKANLMWANLRGAGLVEANLQEAVLFHADLKRANLGGANLHKAVLGRTNLQHALLLGTNVQDALLAVVRLEGAHYAPSSLPPNPYVEGIRGLDSVVIPYDVETRTTALTGMVQLRKLLHEAGLREQERQATFAIEHHKALHAREHGSGLEKVDGWLKLFFFELTTGWGLYPGQALLLALGLAVLLGLVVYPAPIAAAPNHASARHGIFQVWTAEEYGSPLGRVTAMVEVEIERLSANVPKAFLWGLWFSALSTFHIGWRDLNVGTWLSRVQPFPFALRARGWVRVVSGAQSLISVYLVAMWALTYFGRPFP